MFGKTNINDKEVWSATYSQWEQEALLIGEEGQFVAGDITAKLDYQKSLVEKEKDIHAYFITKNDSDEKAAYALIEVAHAQALSDKPWLKLLDITLRPALLPLGDDGTVKIKEAMDVLGYSMGHALDLTYDEHPAAKLKIFGRTQEMRELFEGMLDSSSLDDSLEKAGLEAKMEGKWLVFSKKEENNES